MTGEEKWQALVRRDGRYDGLFFTGVKSTKIFCRPSCKSKRPLRKNVLFFDSAKQAEKAGYRPCKRCRPDLLEYRPLQEIAEQVKLLIDSHVTRQKGLAQKMGRIGVTYHRAARIFKEYYGLTPKKYYDHLRIEEARKRLVETSDTIIHIAYDAGFQSLSAFYKLFEKTMNVPPSQYRKEYGYGIRSHD
jgi:AraC family transcriptional regulator of adaptative response / methylphosphotriester-DNA alkyltransferase methyltransferase